MPEATDTCQISFKVDTRATSCTLKYDNFKRLTSPKFKPSGTLLSLYGHSTVKTLQTVLLACFASNIKRKIIFKWCKSPASPLFRRARKALQLLEPSDCVFQMRKQSNQESLTQKQMLSQYPDILIRLGKLPGVYKIEMNPDFKSVGAYSTTSAQFSSL